MKILYISSFPLPLDSGGNVAVYNTLKTLSECGHDIYLFALAKKEPDKKDMIKLRNILKEVHIYQRPYFINTLLRGIMHPLSSLWILSWYNEEMFKKITIFCSENKVDLMEINKSALYQYLPKKDLNIKKILVFESLAYKSLRRISKFHFSYFKKILYYLDSLKLKLFENNIFKKDKLDAYVFYSHDDLEEIRSKYNYLKNKIYYSSVNLIIPTEDELKSTELASEFKNDNKIILLVGSMDNPSNEDAARWFANDIFPKILKNIPEAHFLIVGKNAINRLSDLVSSRISIKQDVPSLAPYYKIAALVVVPQRGGAGVRIKLLEAMASKKIIVTTSVGVEALSGIKSKQEVILADNEDDFSSAVIDILSNPSRFQKVAENAYAYVKSNHSSKKMINDIKNIHHQIYAS